MRLHNAAFRRAPPAAGLWASAALFLLQQAQPKVSTRSPVSLLQLNLFLAVLKTKFAKAQSLLHEKRRHRRALKAERGRSKQNVLVKAAGWAKGERSLNFCNPHMLCRRFRLLDLAVSPYQGVVLHIGRLLG